MEREIIPRKWITKHFQLLVIIKSRSNANPSPPNYSTQCENMSQKLKQELFLLRSEISTETYRMVKKYASGSLADY